MLLWHEVGRRCQKAIQQLEDAANLASSVNFAVFIRADDLAGQLNHETPNSLSAIHKVVTLIIKRHQLQISIRDFLTDKIKCGDCLLCIDALDEVPVQTRPRPEQLLSQLGTNSKVQLVFTSRYEGVFEAAIVLQSLRILHIKAFTDEQMEASIRAWFDGEAEVGEKVLAKVRVETRLRHVLVSPLLLRIACQVVSDKWKSTGTLPSWNRRVDLNATFFSAMIAGWSHRPPLPSTSQQALMLKFAAEVALQMRARKESTQLNRSVVEIVNEVQKDYPVMSGRALLDDLCHAGIMVRTGFDALNPTFSFAHSTFGEYLTASALATQVQEQGWDRVQRPIDGFASSSEWREVIIFLAGLLTDPTPLLTILADASRDDIYRHRLSLACECLLELPAANALV